ncbi:hypothetical protein EPR50_G00073860 [Perca flavescens]|uniref:Uncharacterized protein n=1 Tax=Perca flavescens TaxID=8167 RepID=A0A484D4P2_PERFV|nr:hypothetical protein EPR50_G00073860 [Perca flavescens]
MRGSHRIVRRVESDRKAASLPSSPDPFKTPSRTSPLLPLPPYPPPEHTSRDGSDVQPVTKDPLCWPV